MAEHEPSIGATDEWYTPLGIFAAFMALVAWGLLRPASRDIHSAMIGKPLPEFGSPEDFQLQQALNQLKGLPVKVSTTLAERKSESKAKD